MEKKTSFTEAIFNLFGDLGDRLDLMGVPRGAVRAYIFGGCAVHMYTRNRVSTDVDVEFDYNLIHRDDVLLVLNELPPVSYDNPALGPVLLNFDPRFSTTLGPLHVDYQDRAVQLTEACDSRSPLALWLPAPLDIAISKLGRLHPVDVEDILLLLHDPAASWREFERLATEASRYYVGRDLTGTIAYIKFQWQRRVHHDSRDEDAE
jgi:hypothetical protein